MKVLLILREQFFLEIDCRIIFDFDSQTHFATRRKNLSKKFYFFSGKILPKNHEVKKYFREKSAKFRAFL